MLLMQGLIGSWEGLKSTDFAIGMADSILVYWVLFCCMRRWPLMVARGFHRCLYMRDMEIPVQVFKWLLLTDQRKVEGLGMETQAWNYPVRSCFILKYWMTPGAGLVVVFMVVSTLGWRGFSTAHWKYFKGIWWWLWHFWICSRCDLRRLWFSHFCIVDLLRSGW